MPVITVKNSDTAYTETLAVDYNDVVTIVVPQPTGIQWKIEGGEPFLAKVGERVVKGDAASARYSVYAVTRPGTGKTTSVIRVFRAPVVPDAAWFLVDEITLTIGAEFTVTPYNTVGQTEGTLNAVVGNPVAVSVQENASTGHTWVPSVVGDAVVLVGSATLDNFAQPGHEGVPSQRLFVFLPVKANGVASISLAETPPGGQPKFPSVIYRINTTGEAPAA